MNTTQPTERHPVTDHPADPVADEQRDPDRPLTRSAQLSEESRLLAGYIEQRIADVDTAVDGAFETMTTVLRDSLDAEANARVAMGQSFGSVLEDIVAQTNTQVNAVVAGLRSDNLKARNTASQEVAELRQELYALRLELAALKASQEAARGMTEALVAGRKGATVRRIVRDPMTDEVTAIVETDDLGDDLGGAA